MSDVKGVENLLIIAVSLFPFAVTILFAFCCSFVISCVEKSVKKKQRVKRKSEHQAQADADMEEIQKVYYEVILNQIMEGNEL